jgi:predicted RNA-binding protein
LTSNTHVPTRDSIGGPKSVTLDAMVDLDEVDLWNDKRVYVNERSVRDQLNFIKNKDKWSMTFGQSIIRISEDDYLAVKSMVG